MREEVANNEYDWDDATVNRYDSEDSFIAAEDSVADDDFEEWETPCPSQEDDDEVVMLSAEELRILDEKPPTRTRRRPERYIPVVEPSEYDNEIGSSSDEDQDTSDSENSGSWSPSPDHDVEGSP